MTSLIFFKFPESEQDRPQIFLSYQWDSQDEVKVLRDKLERSGFMCWMDIGQLGGGDQLYNKIDEALRHCKVGTYKIVIRIELIYENA